MIRANGLLVYNAAWMDSDIGKCYFFTEPIEAKIKCSELKAKDENWRICYASLEMHVETTVVME